MVTVVPGQPPELVIRADIEVPERKLAMTFSFRRNTDKGLPATHTVEITFKLPADFPVGGVSNVPGMLMKQAELTRGVPLAGLAVKVTPGFYLIGLSNQEADKERNLQLLKERGWFDIPVVYNNNRRAILAMEKGHARGSRLRRCVLGLEAVKLPVNRAICRASIASLLSSIAGIFTFACLRLMLAGAKIQSEAAAQNDTHHRTTMTLAPLPSARQPRQYIFARLQRDHRQR